MDSVRHIPGVNNHQHHNEVLQADPNPPLRQNLIVLSGSGKTAAFSLVVQNHANPADKWCQVIILVPTAECAVQTVQAMEKMEGFGLEVKLATFGTFVKGGGPVHQQVVIGTPGTVRDWCWKLKVIDPQKIRVFVVDEADVMMSTQGYQDQSVRIHRMLPDDCQRLLFSASLDDAVTTFTQKMIPNPRVIRLNPGEEIVNHVKQL